MNAFSRTVMLLYGQNQLHSARADNENFGYFNYWISLYSLQTLEFTF